MLQVLKCSHFQNGNDTSLKIFKVNELISLKTLLEASNKVMFPDASFRNVLLSTPQLLSHSAVFLMINTAGILLVWLVFALNAVK